MIRQPIVYTSGMDLTPLIMPPELVQAIAAHGGQPICLEDPATNRIYWLIEEQLSGDEACGDIELDPAYVDRMLDEGIAAIKAGHFVLWDPERIKSLGRRLLAERQAKASS
jgi:hypothetical protein